MLRYTCRVLMSVIENVLRLFAPQSAMYSKSIMNELSRLDDHTLADIGLNRDDVKLLRQGYWPARLVRESIPNRRTGMERRKCARKGSKGTTDLRTTRRSS